MKRIVFFALFLLFSAVATNVYGGKADVTAVKIIPEKNGSYRFEVTVSHDDEGWDHYADKWEVRGSEGTIYGTRILHHPHVSEQPFTRSLSGVVIPAEVQQVTVRAHDSVHLYGGKAVTVAIP